jgi:hypothetical protein
VDLAATLSNPAAKGRDYIIYTCDEAIPEETAKRYFLMGRNVVQARKMLPRKILQRMRR